MSTVADEDDVAPDQQADSKVIPPSIFAALMVLAGLLCLLAIYVWGRRAYDALVVVALLCLLVAHLAALRQDEDTRADVDTALRGLDDLKAHAFGTGPAQTGRHAHPDDVDRYPTHPIPSTDSSWRST